MDPASDGEVDVGDGEQDQGDEQSKGEDLEGVELGIDGAEHGGRDDGYGASYEEDAPKNEG